MQSTREVPLTRGLVAIVDADDYELLMSRGPWYAAHGRVGGFYAERTEGTRATKHRVTMHEVIAGRKWIDHINGNGLDNRRSNLRPTTHKENMRNRGAQRNNTSGYKGVVWHAKTKKWLARINVDGRQISLRYHDDPADAARAYDAAAQEHFGEFAHLNFPPQVAAELE